MGQSTHTTKFSLSLDKRDQGGANCEKRALLGATVQVLTQARTDLTSTSFWPMPTSWQSASPIIRKRIWKCGSGRSVPTSC